jgi:transcriptional regulator with XRE-family HTH domain
MYETEDIARAVRGLRSGSSQAKCATRAGLSLTAWKQIEEGKRRPRSRTRANIAEALGVSPELFEKCIEAASHQRLEVVGGLEEIDAQLKVMRVRLTVFQEFWPEEFSGLSDKLLSFCDALSTRARTLAS